MNSTPASAAYGHLLLTQHREVSEIRIQAEGQHPDGLRLYAIPTSEVASTGIDVIANGVPIARFHNIAVDGSSIAYVYRPGTGNYREFRLGPCTITMDV